MTEFRVCCSGQGDPDSPYLSQRGPHDHYWRQDSLDYAQHFVAVLSSDRAYKKCRPFRIEQRIVGPWEPLEGEQ